MISNTQTHAEGGTVESSAGQQASPGGEQQSPDAIRFGFQPDQFLLPEENQDEYVRFANTMWAKLAPSGMLECSIAARIIGLSWRLQRAGRFEQYLVKAAREGRVEPKKEGPGRPGKSAQLTDGEAIADLLLRTQTFDKAGRHKGHLEAWLHRNLTRLWDLQKARQEETARRAHLLSGQRQ